jgi:GNAT superfamily N-acetyltransferase
MSQIHVRRATDADAVAVADVFIASRKAALPSVPNIHPEDDIRGYVRDILIGEHETWVATDDGGVVGMIALTPGWVDQLYIAPDRLGEGIGRRLLDLAKERSPGELQLWTFQVNTRARRFYEINGMTIAEMTDGAGNEEREPDIRYVWSAPVAD